MFWAMLCQNIALTKKSTKIYKGIMEFYPCALNLDRTLIFFIAIIKQMNLRSRNGTLTIYLNYQHGILLSCFGWCSWLLLGHIGKDPETIKLIFQLCRKSLKLGQHWSVLRCLFLFLILVNGQLKIFGGLYDISLWVWWFLCHKYYIYFLCSWTTGICCPYIVFLSNAINLSSSWVK